MPPAAIAAPPAPVSIIHTGFGGFIKKFKVVAHYGFVPLVLYLGFESDPDGRVGLLQLFLPI